LVILVAASYRVVIDRLLAAMEQAGLRGMKPAYGFVIRAVAAEGPGINRLAELLGVSKQAASKAAEEMLEQGFLRSAPDPRDRRRTRLLLGKKGERVLATALATSAELEREVAEALGPAGAKALRRALLHLAERGGALAEVTARRARPVW
jgi:DNA-binding MarR family transcriptional regulator